MIAKHVLLDIGARSVTRCFSLSFLMFFPLWYFPLNSAFVARHSDVACNEVFFGAKQTHIISQGGGLHGGRLEQSLFFFTGVVTGKA